VSAYEGNSVLVTASASENAEEFIRAMIFSGRLGPGERLPTGVELSAQLGISVVTLRLALKSLEAHGYIVTTRGAHGGSRVSDVAGLKRCWDNWLHEHADELDDLFELRTTIEMRIAALAAERRTSSDLEALETANALLLGPGAPLVPWNVGFHDALARAAHSKYLAEASFDVQKRLFLPVDLAEHPHLFPELTATHAVIHDAVRDRAPEAAAEAMRVHLADTLVLFRKSL
jgi:GntR family transcriptional regulator, transcriptional repressor for pyruvate dehydrogenase complex